MALGHTRDKENGMEIFSTGMSMPYDVPCSLYTRICGRSSNGLWHVLMYTLQEDVGYSMLDG